MIGEQELLNMRSQFLAFTSQKNLLMPSAHHIEIDGLFFAFPAQQIRNCPKEVQENSVSKAADFTDLNKRFDAEDTQKLTETFVADEHAEYFKKEINTQNSDMIKDKCLHTANVTKA